MDEVRVYHLPPERFRVIHRRLLVLLAGVTAIVGVVIAGYIFQAGMPHRPAQWVPSLVLFGGYALFQLRLAKRAATRRMTYQLTLGPNVLRIVCDGLVPTELLRTDVTRIVESARGLVLHAGGRVVGVPYDLGGYDEVRTRLGAWRTIERARFGAWRTSLFLVQAGLWLVAGMMPVPTSIVVACLVASAALTVVVTLVMARTTSTRRVQGSMLAIQLLLLLFLGLRVAGFWGGR
jgi:hypothetical protein